MTKKKTNIRVRAERYTKTRLTDVWGDFTPTEQERLIAGGEEMFRNLESTKEQYLKEVREIRAGTT